MNEPVELDDIARRVITDGRHAFDPAELVTARVRRAVENQLASGASVPKWQEGNASRGWVKILVGAAAASVATAALAYAAWRPRPVVAPSVVPISAAPVNPAPQGHGTNVAAVESKPDPLPSPVASQTQPSAMRTPTGNVNKSETLAEEVKLLVSVKSAIQNREGGEALRLLRVYDQQFKRPQLREERAAAGVLALCAAGRIQAARDAAKRFEAAWPRSPLTARVVDSCISSK